MIQLAREQFKWVSVHIHMYRKEKEKEESIWFMEQNREIDRLIDHKVDTYIWEGKKTKTKIHKVIFSHHLTNTNNDDRINRIQTLNTILLTMNRLLIFVNIQWKELWTNRHYTHTHIEREREKRCLIYLYSALTKLDAIITQSKEINAMKSFK